MEGEFAIGLDLGGTELKSALVRKDGSLEGFGRRPSRAAQGAEATFEVVAEAVAALRGRAPGRLVGIGLGCPGMISPDRGSLVGRTAHLPHWLDTPVAEHLAALLGEPVAVDNDANLAALAEERCGAARGARVTLAITLGTGIGCGIVVDGHVFRGAGGGAGELGHVPLGRTGRPCACEVTDCVEPEASGSGLVEDARRLGLDPPAAEAVFAAAGRGNRAAMEVVARFADRLGAAVATAVNLLNPEVVVVGGGVARAGESLLEPLREAVVRYGLGSHRRGLRLVPAALGDQAGTVGAGLLAWDRARRA